MDIFKIDVIFYFFYHKYMWCLWNHTNAINIVDSDGLVFQCHIISKHSAEYTPLHF